MLAYPTNPALDLPHFKEKIQLEVVIMEVEQNEGFIASVITPRTMDTKLKKFKVWQKNSVPLRRSFVNIFWPLTYQA